MFDKSPENTFEWIIGIEQDMESSVTFSESFLKSNWPKGLTETFTENHLLSLDDDRDQTVHGEEQRFFLNRNALAMFTARSLRLIGEPELMVQDQLWSLGRFPDQNLFGQVFLVRGVQGEKWPDARKVFAPLAHDAKGLCLNLGWERNAPQWMPKGLCFVTLHTAMRYTKKKLWLDAEYLENLLEEHKQKSLHAVPKRPEIERPPKLVVSGNQALDDRDLIRAWRMYLDTLSPLKKIEVIENETSDLSWSQNQRADFIGMDRSQYSRMNIKRKKSSESDSL